MPKKLHKAPPDLSLPDPPTNLDFEKSLMFFHAYMYGPLQWKLRLYGARAIPVGSFASMLVNDMGRKFGPGIDLTNYPYGWVKQNGILLMTIKDGEIVLPKLVFEVAPDG